jgi:hypothetical protein
MSTERKPRKSFIFGKRKKTPDPVVVEEQQAAEQPKLPAKIKRRKSKPLVYVDDGVLVVRTPAETTKWDHEFRLAIVRDYRNPKTLKMASEFARIKVDRGFLVLGRKVHVRHVYQELASGQVVVLGMQVADLATNRVLSLVHADAAMRVLMVYAFLREVKIAGVPDLDIAEWTP